MNTVTVFPKRMGFAPVSFNSILNEVFNDNLFNGADFSNSTPMVNIKETGNGFHLEIAAPGLQKENFEVTMDKNILTISAQKQTEQKQEGEKYTRKEFNYTSFKRSFTLPETIDTTNIKAIYENGILKVDVSKKAEAKPEVKKIEIA
jgi:HSP20 family protein